MTGGTDHSLPPLLVSGQEAMAAELGTSDNTVPDWPPLAGDQVSALPEGSTVIALWSDGQGPGQYTVHRESGRLYAQSTSDLASGVLNREKALTFVTRVWLPAA
jgi:hypothetical protein